MTARLEVQLTCDTIAEKLNEVSLEECVEMLGHLVPLGIDGEDKRERVHLLRHYIAQRIGCADHKTYVSSVYELLPTRYKEDDFEINARAHLLYAGAQTFHDLEHVFRVVEDTEVAQELLEKMKKVGTMQDWSSLRRKCTAPLPLQEEASRQILLAQSAAGGSSS